MSTRIYAIKVQGETRLVNARTRAQAVHYVAEDTIKASVASQQMLVQLTRAGVEVEDATNNPTTEVDSDE
jgi:hypothetical protein